MGDTVFIGVNSHAKNGVQVDAFGLLWKDGVYPEYDEAFISRNTGALSEIELALRVSVLISTFIPTRLDLNKVCRLLCMRFELQIQKIH